MEGFNKYIVIWDNPRRVEKCSIHSTSKGFHRLILESDGTAHWRRPRMVFLSKEEVDNYLKIEDYRSIH